MSDFTDVMSQTPSGLFSPIQPQSYQNGGLDKVNNWASKREGLCIFEDGDKIALIP